MKIDLSLPDPKQIVCVATQVIELVWIFLLTVLLDYRLEWIVLFRQQEDAIEMAKIN